jgi:hypothetical protein
VITQQGLLCKQTSDKEYTVDMDKQLSFEGQHTQDMDGVLQSRHSCLSLGMYSSRSIL